SKELSPSWRQFWASTRMATRRMATHETTGVLYHCRRRDTVAPLPGLAPAQRRRYFCPLIVRGGNLASHYPAVARAWAAQLAGSRRDIWEPHPPDRRCRRSASASIDNRGTVPDRGPWTQLRHWIRSLVGRQLVRAGCGLPAAQSRRPLREPDRGRGARVGPDFADHRPDGRNRCRRPWSGSGGQPLLDD